MNRLITILTAGTRGDTQPYIALGQELQDLGYKVKIAASRGLEALVRGYGLSYAPVNADMNSLSDEEKSVIKKATESDNPIKMLLSFNKLKHFAIRMQDDLYAACKGSEAIIYHPGATIGYFAAKQTGIPAILATPFPFATTKEYPSVLLYGRFMGGKLMNSLSWALLRKALWTASATPVTKFWQSRFGYPPEDFSCPFDKTPMFMNCSDHVFPHASDWRQNVHQCGYWFVREQEDYSPPENLVNFLSDGKPPIYVGFGSVSREEQAEKMTQIVIDALHKAGQRGILATGWNGLARPKDIPGSIYILESIPHTWLFPKTATVIHHGGAGTTAAGFAAGVPSIIIPFGNDQPAWGRRVFDLGVGAKPIPQKRLTSVALAEAIRFSLRPEIVKNAAQLGEKLREENGAKTTAELIDRYVLQDKARIGPAPQIP